jgi:hypothetical protein
MIVCNPRLAEPSIHLSLLICPFIHVIPSEGSFVPGQRPSLSPTAPSDGNEAQDATSSHDLDAWERVLAGDHA